MSPATLAPPAPVVETPGGLLQRRLLRLVLGLLVIAGAIVVPIPNVASGAVETCCAYLLAGSGGAAGGNDLLTDLDLADGNPATNENDIGSGTGTTPMRGLDVHPTTGVIYAVDGGTFGSISAASGLFSTIGVIGSGAGSQGVQPASDVSALAFDPTNSFLYAVENQPGAEDLLFRIDVGTGAIVADAFGAGVDYVRIQTDGARDEAQGLAIEPVTGNMYASLGDDGSSQNQRIVTVNKLNGETTSIGDTDPPIIKGLDFDGSGTLWGTGYIRGTPDEQSVYEIDTTDASTISSIPIDNGGNYEAIGFTALAPNQPPAFDADLLDRADAEGAVISLAAGATDPDLDTLLYSATGLPPGLSIGSGSGLISGTINFTAAAGSPYAVEITATDDGTPNLDATDTFAWTISATTPDVCYVTTNPPAGNDILGWVNSLDLDPATNEITIGATGTTGISSLTSHPGSGTVYAANFDRLGTLDTATAAFTPSPQPFGSGDGPVGPHSFANADGLAFDTLRGTLFAVESMVGGALLFAVDPVGGSVIPDTFGVGLAYAVVAAPPGFGTSLLKEIAFAPGDGSPYAVMDAPDGSHLVRIDTTTLNATDIGLMAPDVTGISVDGDGVIWAVERSGALSRVHPGSGTLSESRVLDNSIQYLTISCQMAIGGSGPTAIDDTATTPENTSVDIGVLANDNDPDGDGIKILEFTQPANGTVTNNGDGTLRYQPDADWTGIDGFSYTITDGLGGVASALVSVTVTAVNQNPIFNGDLLDRLDAEGSVISLSAAATDPDLDALLYTVTGLPPGLSIDPGSGLISGTINYSAAAGSPYSVVVTVTDNGVPNLDATDTFTWTVTNTNRNPVFDGDLSDRVGGEGSAISLSAGATDPDLDTLLYTATGLPSGLSIDPTSGLISGTVGFGAAAGSPYAVEVTVTDNGVPNLNAADTFTWTVTNTNRNPIFDSDLLDRADAEGAVISLAAGATDPDLDALLFTAAGLPPGLSIDSGSGLISGTIDYTAAAGAPYAVEITVTDNGVPNLDATDTFAWVVTNTNRNPIFDGDLLDRSDAEGSVISLSAGATDPDLDTLLYAATGLPPGLIIDPGSGLISGTVGFGAAASSPFAVEITVTDDGAPNLDATDTFTWTVTNTNRNPIFDSDLLDRADGEAAVVSLAAGATDPDLDTLLYTATGLPTGLSIDPGTGLISGTIDFTAAAGSPYAVEITVTDNGTPNLDATDTFTWTVVNSNRGPVFDADLLDRADAEGVVISLPSGATDPDLDAVFYSATGLPPGLAIDPGTGLISGTINFTAAAGSPYAVEITATDSGTPNLNATDTFTWTVTNTNRNPIFDSDLVDRAGAEGTVVSLAAGATDPDLDTLLYSATGLPTGLTIDSGSGLISGTIAFTASTGSPYAVEVTVTDNGVPNLDATDTFNWTVTNTNRNPIFDTDLLDRADAEGAAISLAAGATDPDFESLLYSAIGLPPGLSIHPGTGLISGTIDFTAEAGSPYAVEITVTDNGVPNLDATDTFTWTVTGTNRNPAFDADLPDRTDPEGAVVLLSAAATDPDLDTLVYSATGLPPGFTINAVTGLIAGTMSFTAAAGSPYAVEVTVTDNGVPKLAATDTFTWTVTDVNRSPVFDSDLLDRADGEAAVVSLPATASDPDLDTLAYSATGLPPGLSIDPGSGLISGTISFTASTGSPYAVEVTVIDDGVPNLSAVDTFAWAVVNSNRGPVFNADLADRTDPEDTVISVSAAATDPDADTVSYSATGLPPGLSINRTTGLVSGTIDFSAAADSPYAVAVTATDSGTPSLSTVDTFTWTVTNTNRPPALDLIADLVGAEQTPISFTAIGRDPDLNELVFSLVGAPPGAVIEPGSGVFTWTPTEIQGPGTYSITVVVTDTARPPLTDRQIVRVTVAEANRPPSIAPIVEQLHGEGGTVELTVAGTDPDLPSNTLTYRAAGLPPGIVIDPVSGVIVGTIHAEAAANSPYTVEITVTDVGTPELNAVHTFTWTVANVDAPAGLRKKQVVDALVGFEEETIAEPEARPVRRGLVLMGATASASAAALRWPLGILLVLLVGFITVGRIGLYPVLRRGDRFTGVIGFYDDELGFGLVTPDDDSKEIFIHANAFPQRQRPRLEAGTRVRYRLFVDDNRPCAWAATTIDRRDTNGRTSP